MHRLALRRRGGWSGSRWQRTWPSRSTRRPKRHAETDRADSQHLRQRLIDGRLPGCWISPAHVLEARALLETYHDLSVEHTAWVQRIHAVPFHQGAPSSRGLRGAQGQAELAAITATELSAAGQLQVATALMAPWQSAKPAT